MKNIYFSGLKMIDKTFRSSGAGECFVSFSTNIRVLTDSTEQIEKNESHLHRNQMFIKVN